MTRINRRGNRSRWCMRWWRIVQMRLVRMRGIITHLWLCLRSQNSRRSSSTWRRRSCRGLRLRRIRSRHRRNSGWRPGGRRISCNWWRLGYWCRWWISRVDILRLTRRIARMRWVYGYVRRWWLHISVIRRNTGWRIRSCRCSSSWSRGRSSCRWTGISWLLRKCLSFLRASWTRSWWRSNVLLILGSLRLGAICRLGQRRRHRY